MTRAAELDRVDGVLVIDKPSGPTSHDLVAAARRLFATREVGHAGTLDPMAPGVLLLLFGQACKLSAYLTAADKTYQATVVFGRATSSGDADGVTTDERKLTPGWLSPDTLAAALAEERARVEQVPPAVSAIQVGGVRAHQASRRGEPLALAPRSVAVRRLELVERQEHAVTLELTVSKGYYVRALARDLGQRLGVPAHLAALRRTASGGFGIEAASPWPPAGVPALLGLAEAARRALPDATLTEQGVQRARFGQALSPEHFHAPPPEGIAAWLDAGGELIALGEPRAEGLFGVVRGFTRGAAVRARG